MSRSTREKLKKHPQPPPIAVSERRPRGPVVQPIIPLPPATDFGPSMLALPNDAQRAFVIGKVIFGLSSVEAARQAGYSAASPHALDVHGSRLAHDDRIQAALLEQGQRLMRSEGPKSVHTLIAVRDDKNASNKDRLSAAKELLDRSGFHAVSESHVTVEHLTEAQQDQKIIALCRELGLTEDVARRMLIAPDAIDAEWEEVKPEPTEEERAAASKRDHENTLRRQRRSMTPEQLAAHKEQVRQKRRERGKQRHEAAQQQAMCSDGIEDLWEGINLSGDLP